MKAVVLIFLLNLTIFNYFFFNSVQSHQGRLPGCETFDTEKCKSDTQFHSNPEVNSRRWQTPKPGAENYQKSFQDYHSLVGYADIVYESPERTKALVCIKAIHKNNDINLEYFFNEQKESSNCKNFDSSFKSEVKLSVKASDGSKLEIDPIVFAWNNPKIPERPGDFRKGQKGGIIELFGWKHTDAQKECEIIAKAGYLGIKLDPVVEQLMSSEPVENRMNPWFFMYQPVSFRLNGRAGTREEFLNLVNGCRALGARVYLDVVINHFTGMGNDLYEHRDQTPNGCIQWTNKTTSAPFDRQSPFYTHKYTYELNNGQQPSNEFPAAAIGPEDFHCERPLNKWDDLFILNNGWLWGLTDLDTSRENVRERLASFLVELISIGVSGFRIDAAKHISPEDLTAIFKKIQIKLGGKLPDDFLAWLEIVSGNEGFVLWNGPSWYGNVFHDLLFKELGSEEEVDKIKIFDAYYPNRARDNKNVPRKRIVIQNDDHDSQMPGFIRDLEPNGCVLVKDCPIDEHRNYEMRLFESPYEVDNNAEDWPIRVVLSSFYLTYSPYGIPDGLSDCKVCVHKCDECTNSVPFIPAYVADECGYDGKGYTKVHRDLKIVNSMRKWMQLDPIKGADLGLENCN